MTLKKKIICFFIFFFVIVLTFHLGLQSLIPNAYAASLLDEAKEAATDLYYKAKALVDPKAAQEDLVAELGIPLAEVNFNCNSSLPGDCCVEKDEGSCASEWKKKNRCIRATNDPKRYCIDGIEEGKRSAQHVLEMMKTTRNFSFSTMLRGGKGGIEYPSEITTEMLGNFCEIMKGWCFPPDHKDYPGTQFFNKNEWRVFAKNRVINFNWALFYSIALTEGFGDAFGQESLQNAHVGRDLLWFAGSILGFESCLPGGEIERQLQEFLATLDAYGGGSALTGGQPNSSLFSRWHSNPAWFRKTSGFYKVIVSFCQRHPEVCGNVEEDITNKASENYSNCRRPPLTSRISGTITLLTNKNTEGVDVIDVFALARPTSGWEGYNGYISNFFKYDKKDKNLNFNLMVSPESYSIELTARKKVGDAIFTAAEYKYPQELVVNENEDKKVDLELDLRMQKVFGKVHILTDQNTNTKGEDKKVDLMFDLRTNITPTPSPSPTSCTFETTYSLSHLVGRITREDGSDPSTSECNEIKSSLLPLITKRDLKVGVSRREILIKQMDRVAKLQAEVTVNNARTQNLVAEAWGIYLSDDSTVVASGNQNINGIFIPLENLPRPLVGKAGETPSRLKLILKGTGTNYQKQNFFQQVYQKTEDFLSHLLGAGSSPAEYNIEITADTNQSYDFSCECVWKEVCKSEDINFGELSTCSNPSAQVCCRKTESPSPTPTPTIPSYSCCWPWESCNGTNYGWGRYGCQIYQRACTSCGSTPLFTPTPTPTTSCANCVCCPYGKFCSENCGIGGDCSLQYYQGCCVSCTDYPTLTPTPTPTSRPRPTPTPTFTPTPTPRTGYGSCGTCFWDNGITKVNDCTPLNECRVVYNEDECRRNSGGRWGYGCCLRDKCGCNPVAYPSECASGCGDNRCSFQSGTTTVRRPCHKYNFSTGQCEQNINCPNGSPKKPSLRTPNGAYFTLGSGVTLEWWGYREGDRYGHRDSCTPETTNDPQPMWEGNCWGYVCAKTDYPQWSILPEWRYYEVYVREKNGPTDFKRICKIKNIPNPQRLGDGLGPGKTSCVLNFDPNDRTPRTYEWFVRAGYEVNTGFETHTDSEVREFSLIEPTSNCGLYNSNWVKITDFNTLSPNQAVFLATKAIPNATKAAFKINGLASPIWCNGQGLSLVNGWCETTLKRNDLFYLPLTIQKGLYQVESRVY